MAFILEHPFITLIISLSAISAVENVFIQCFRTNYIETPAEGKETSSAGEEE